MKWNDNLEICSLPQGTVNFRNFCFSEQICHRKQSLGAPGKLSAPYNMKRREA